LGEQKVANKTIYGPHTV